MCCHVREGGAAMNRLLYEGGRGRDECAAM